ncbi:unnamed protein product [Arabidopsis thaliana]|uniref:(thale cress) hypothetical protein n=1 Tax=Arabidopsis thaliana TaxID=3702 RepID=A0A7G2EJD0_ARATH|nr:unnamed protein product [Arabidopsis thaliana]
MIPRDRHLLGLDKMEAGGKASRDELLKLSWNVTEFEKPSCEELPRNRMTN